MQPCYCGNPCWFPELTSWTHLFFPGSEDVWRRVFWVYSSNECSLRCFSWLQVYKRTGLTLMTDYKALHYWEYFSDLLLHGESSKPASLFSKKRCFACHTQSHLHHFNFPLVLFEPKNLHMFKSTATPWYRCSSYILAMTIYTFPGFKINVYLLTSEAKKRETLSILSVNSVFFFCLSLTQTCDY